jgi:predicted sugar kinase
LIGVGAFTAVVATGGVAVYAVSHGGFVVSAGRVLIVAGAAAV